MEDRQIVGLPASGSQTIKTRDVAISWQDTCRGRNVLRCAAFDFNGFGCVVNVEYDYDHDFTQFRGRFTDEEEEGAVENPTYNGDSRTYRYFVPENTEESHYKGLLELHYSPEEARRLAHKYVMEDALIAADPDRAGLIACLVQATASYKGIELGVACLGGIEVESSGNHYIEEIAWEQVGEAIIEAKKKIIAIREG